MKYSKQGMIGISIPEPTIDVVIAIDDKYAEFDIKRLTKSNSFMVLGDIFYIAKKNHIGKASKIYHVYRVSDKRYITPSVLDKEETIMMVMNRYKG